MRHAADLFAYAEQIHSVADLRDGALNRDDFDVIAAMPSTHDRYPARLISTEKTGLLRADSTRVGSMDARSSCPLSNRPEPLQPSARGVVRRVCGASHTGASVLNLRSCIACRIVSTCYETEHPVVRVHPNPLVKAA
jgi:hypothetical protein